jgi:hypothetical protein
VLQRHQLNHQHPQRKHLISLDVVVFGVVAAAQLCELGRAEVGDRLGGCCDQLQVGLSEVREVRVEQLEGVVGGDQDVVGFYVAVEAVVLMQVF